MTGKYRNIMGPVDYLILKFPGNKFTGKIAPELDALEKKGTIRVIDLVLIMKDEKGKLTINEAKNLKGELGDAYRELAKHTDDWFSETDIEVFAESLPDNCSGALILFENLWAIRLKQALLDSEAEMVEMGRIPPETVRTVEEQLTAKGDD